jgi:hypothetical protein
MQSGGMKDRRQGRICRKEERRTGDREDSAGRRNEVQEIGRNRQAERKKYRRLGGIWRKEESKTVNRVEYAGRRNEGKQDSRQRGICRQEE